jgi:sec-independent protein translocase protein TatA
VTPNIGPLELGIVLIIALIVLGPKRLPEVGRSIGKGLREFKESLSAGMDHLEEDDDDPIEVVDADEHEHEHEPEHVSVPRD